MISSDIRRSRTCPSRIAVTLLLWLLIVNGLREMMTTSTLAITTACPSVCFCDETNYVNCVGDGLWEVPTDIPKTVVRLELRNYIIGVLTVSAVQELVDLLELKLQQTKIHSIENGTFSNLTRLLRLDLSQNLMETIGSTMFEGLNSLRYLDLSTNRVTNMDEPFVDLVNLEQLNLRENLLPQLTVKSFAGLYKVQYLNLDSNQIASIEVGTFQYLTNLAHLIVSNNPLTALSRLDFFGSRLQYIDVSRVGLQRVPQSLTRYVRDLRLAKNNLTHIHLGDFDSYPYLSLLVLDDNALVDIESDALGRQEYLVRLWLNGNMLQQIPANLPPSLRVLYAEENLLKVIAPFSFQGLFNLEQLFLQRNQIKRLDPGAFCDLLSLRHLHLQANMLETISEGAFANLSSLVSLDLSQNPIKLLAEGCFNGLDNLKTLQLSRMKTQLQFSGSVFNPLKKLETLEVYDSPDFAINLVTTTRALQGLRSLRELNLMNNNLVTLRSDFPHFFPQLKVAKLGGNYWSCDKDILWLTNWIKKADTHFYHSYSIWCSHPKELLHRPIMMLKSEDFVTTSRSTTTLTSPTVVISTSETVTTMSTQSLTTQAPTLQPPMTEVINSISTVVHTSSTTKTTVSSQTNETSSDTLEMKPSYLSNDSMVDASLVSTADNTSSTTMTSTARSTFTTFTMPTTTTSTENISQSVTVTSLTTTISGPSTTFLPHSSQSKSTDIIGFDAGNSTEEFIDFKTTIDDDSHSTTTTRVTATDVPVTNVSKIHQSSEEIKINILQKETVSENTEDVSVNETSDNGDSVVVIVASVITGFGLVILGLVLSFVLKCRAATVFGLNCKMRRSSSSISYSPQRDEVSIVTVSEGTVGLQTLTHQGLSNKLYFVLENGSDSSSSSRDLSKEALPDPSLRQLLPDTTNCYPTVRHAKTLARKARTYCLAK